ncbi:hypothetical protein [Cohnella sp. GCM10027633]|uniref:hypothetical protein n=1 Tax=unclassified Cohnella TaxID=2636738 RepID=UPI003629A158
MSADTMNAPAEAVRFPCDGCGGPMAFDSETQGLKCRYCGADKTIENALAEPREHPFGGAGDSPGLRDWGTKQTAIHCESCGGETLIPAGQTTGSCAFCGSPKVLEQEDTETIRPETLVPFQISGEEARASFAAWKKKRWFLPSAFKRMNVSSQLSSIYIPYWTYDTDTYSVYSAERGDYHYRTVQKTRIVNGKTETTTEQERYTVWTRVNGDHDRAFDDMLVPASGHYNAKLLQKLGDFDLGQLLPYKPEYLSGYISEKYSVTCEEGWERAQNEAEERLEREIRGRIGGDEIRSLDIRTTYSDVTYKHLLLPVWNASYTYQGKSYHYMVNGQTGTVSGYVPRSAWKIALFTLACLAVAGAIALFFIGQQTPA